MQTCASAIYQTNLHHFISPAGNEYIYLIELKLIDLPQLDGKPGAFRGPWGKLHMLVNPALFEQKFMPYTK